jgi:hypothetical protein
LGELGELGRLGEFGELGRLGEFGELGRLGGQGTPDVLAAVRDIAAVVWLFIVASILDRWAVDYLRT